MNSIKRRPVSSSADTLALSGMNPIMARLYASRGVEKITDLDYSLAGLIPPSMLLNADRAAVILADAIRDDKHVVVSCDFDVDGCAAGAIALRALKMMGLKHVDFAMPNRKTHGYGISPPLIREIADRFKPDMIMTVDCGVSGFEGVAEARRLGIDVLITDHHLAGDGLPDAICIVNPNQLGCPFPSKHLAGAGVIFYVMLALRAELRRRGVFEGGLEPDLSRLLDLVALATVADVVGLDRNNRILVENGLRRIRKGRACVGINALMRVAGKEPKKMTSADLGFVVGPRLNAAGRMDDMSVGMECLMTDNDMVAMDIAAGLNQTNRERREVEASMRGDADAALQGVSVRDGYSLVMFDPGWHQGVIGILASRLKDEHGRPTIVFAKGDDGFIKGSGRSIYGLHLRDAIDLVAKRNPGLITAFGGHAMAAGLTCVEAEFSRFVEEFERVCRERLDESHLSRVIETDGEIPNSCITIDLARQISGAVWGQGFLEPVFDDEFVILEQRILKDAHLKLKLEKGGAVFDGIWFFRKELIPARVRLVYSLDVNEFNGNTTVQMLIKHAEA